MSLWSWLEAQEGWASSSHSPDHAYFALAAIAKRPFAPFKQWFKRRRTWFDLGGWPRRPSPGDPSHPPLDYSRLGWPALGRHRTAPRWSKAAKVMHQKAVAYDDRGDDVHLIPLFGGN